ncbi:MAG: NAD(P)H-quinone oxidoreductase [Proteobacteria bacterium]|nr:NAD(P)H-quinone oxidoreductase [Pseudomonadota bacterium]
MPNSLPKTMTAIEIAEPGGPEMLRPVERPVPVPAEGEVLIRVAAAGVNRADCLQRQGGYPPPKGASDIPGLECAGHLAARGPGTSGFAVGEAVCALLTGGGYAEYVAVPAGQCLPVPKGLSMAEAAGAPETFCTVWHNVFERGGLKSGEVFLCHGGSSGIGTTAIQLAKAAGARVFTTAGSAEKCTACTDLGAARAINYREEDFVEIVKAETGGRGANLILDMVGGDYVQRNISALGAEGRLVYIAFLGGAKTELNLGPLMMKRATLTGSTLRARPAAEKGRIVATMRGHCWPGLADGRFKVLVHQTFPLAEAAKAHTLMETSAHIGKIVLTVGEG